MNVYDFDKTIYHKDTTARFYLWSLKKWPKIARHLPKVIWAALKMKVGLCDKTAFKTVFLCFLRDVPQPEKEIEAFWDANMPLIHRWYLERKRPDDVVITASPVDFVKPACRRLGISQVLGSPVDIRTGLYSGQNCHGAEKVRVFRLNYPDGVVEEFYSDSHNDDPMAAEAQKAYMVHGERLKPWPMDR